MNVQQYAALHGKSAKRVTAQLRAGKLKGTRRECKWGGYIWELEDQPWPEVTRTRLVAADAPFDGMGLWLAEVAGSFRRSRIERLRIQLLSNPFPEDPAVREELDRLERIEATAYASARGAAGRRAWASGCRARSPLTGPSCTCDDAGSASEQSTESILRPPPLA